MSDLVTAGLLNDNELEIIEDLDKRFPGISKNFLPIVWASSIVVKARKEGRIRDDFAVKTLIDELNKFRGQCGTLMAYNTISIPLVYTQVVTIAVYTYFIFALFAQQWLEKNGKAIDLIPFLIILQFIFYMGWLKVAETLMNPFGEDDDDFEVSGMIDRNLVTSYLIVDDMHKDHPELLKDQYWNDTPQCLADISDDQIATTFPIVSDTANFDVTSRQASVFRRRSTHVSFKANSEDADGGDDVELGESFESSDKVRKSVSVAEALRDFKFSGKVYTHVGCEPKFEAEIVGCLWEIQKRRGSNERADDSRTRDGRNKTAGRREDRRTETEKIPFKIVQSMIIISA